MSKATQSFDVHLKVGIGYGSKVFDSVTGEEIKDVRNIYLTHKGGRSATVRLEIIASKDGKMFLDGDNVATYGITGLLNSIIEIK